MLNNTFVPATGTNFIPSEFSYGRSFVAVIRPPLLPFAPPDDDPPPPASGPSFLQPPAASPAASTPAHSHDRKKNMFTRIARLVVRSITSVELKPPS